MARYRPLTDAQWSAPIVWRLAGACTIVSIVAYLVSVTVLLAVTGLPPRDPAVQLVAVGVSVAASCVAAVTAVRVRVAPLFELVSWSAAQARHRWARLGFADGVPNPRTGLEALADRSDDAARSGRASLLAALNEPGELDEFLRGWEPQTPTGAAALERHRLMLDTLRGRRSDASAAYAAASAIADASDRAVSLVALHLDAAARESHAGRSPEAELRAARRLLDGVPLEVPLPGGGPNLVVIAVTLAVVSCAVPVAVGALLVAGVVGLAAWVAAVFLFWIGVRAFIARRNRMMALGRASG